MRGVILGIVLALAAPLTALALAPRSSTPQDAAASYVDLIVIPALSGRMPSAQNLAEFYWTATAIRSQMVVAEDQFAAYWQGVAKRTTGVRLLGVKLPIGSFSLSYLGEPVYNDAGDEARLKVTVIVTTRQGALLSSQSQAFSVDAIKEADAWKMVFPEDAVHEMQKIPTRVLRRRLPVQKTVFAKGIRLTVAAITLDRESTTVDLSVENATDQSVDLLGPLSDSALTDATGRSYASQTLRSSLAGVIAPRQSVSGTIVFFPLSAVSKRVVLTLPGIQVGDEMFSLSLGID